ncbi:MAG: MoxR family ATPase [Chloroflexi bacterium]|nr:MoxR family ATPase [Chloroflexota bacterium]
MDTEGVVVSPSDPGSIDVFGEYFERIASNVETVIQGKRDVIDLILLGLVSEGHVLVEDVPGVGKTQLAKSLARSVEGAFNRIQFTPDLYPTDITGGPIYNKQTQSFEDRPGPIRTGNCVLCDEINRGLPMTQSAMLEAMGEGHVTFDGIAYPLPKPFFVIATRNLAEAHGVFPLPQSQLDRFLLSFGIGYPKREEEVEILERHEHREPVLSPVLTADDIATMQEQIHLVEVARPVKEYIANIVAETRRSSEIVIGVSPRGAVFLQRAAQARAAMEGRNFATPDDVKGVSPAVLRHRFLPRSSEPDSPAKCLEAVLSTVPVPL